MSKFIQKLNLFYQKQPAQIRKILACLKDLSNDENVSIEKIRTKICPLFKNNQLLIDWFLQCLGNDKSMHECSKDEYETIMFRKTTETIADETETYEYIPQSEILPDPTDNPCNIRYMNGRLFYGNRLSFPAKLAFSAPTKIDSINFDVNKIPINYGNKMHTYKCSHYIQSIDDIKTRDKNRNNYDHELIDECDNSDDDQHHQNETNLTYETKIEIEKDDERVSRDILCDDITLKAHKVRLNPSAYLSPTTNSIDYLNLLKPQEITNECDSKPSPKKNLLNRSNSQTMTKTKKCSPIAKKHTTILPTNQSPTKKSSIQIPSSQIILSSNENSNATKRVKRLISTSLGLSEGPSNDMKINVENTKKRLMPMELCSENKFRKIQTKNKIRISGNDGIESTQSNSTINNENDKNPDMDMKIQFKTDDWTREEDRLLLEHIKKGLEPNDKFIDNITHEFPNKTTDLIKLRVEFLIDFLTKLKYK